jgi:hypothetical protein
MKANQRGAKGAPTTSDGVYRLFGNNKDGYVAFWAERLGPGAAEAKWRTARFRAYTQLSQVVWYPLLAFGLWNRLPILIVPVPS